MALRYPWASDPPPAEAPPLPQTVPAGAKRRGRRLAAPPASAAEPPVWLYHHLTVSGPAASVRGFAATARGAGIIPWRLDYDSMEEDLFLRAATQPAERRNLTVAGCRILARQFRARVEEHQARGAALVGTSRACPFDLHALLPVPDAVLALGPSDPQALAWLSEHWGTTDRLRQVSERAPPAGTDQRLARGLRMVCYGFFTVGDTPDAAVSRLAAGWPALVFSLQARPST